MSLLDVTTQSLPLLLSALLPLLVLISYPSPLSGLDLSDNERQETDIGKKRVVMYFWHPHLMHSLRKNSPKCPWASNLNIKKSHAASLCL